MPILAAKTRLKPYFGYRNANRLVLTARALRGSEADWKHRTTFGKMRRLYRAFASREIAELAVAIEARSGERVARAVRTTNSEGFCHFDIELDSDWPLPERSEWESVTLRWTARGRQEEASGLVLVPGTAHDLGIISDIDDTIMETGAHDLLRNWRRVLATMPGERSPVPGSVELYTQLGGARAGEHFEATERPFFYVSSSPWNLFDYLVAFKKAHGLPLGPMMLRDWGFNRATLGGGAHGAHKTAAIGQIAGFYPDLRFALIGDSTQADAEAFAEAVKSHPGRFAGVLLRTAPGATVNDAEEAALEAIREAGVPVWLGESYSLDRDFLAKLGLAGDDEAESVVEETKKEGEPSAAVQPSAP